ncbi:hypothetical protein EV356DRAFT_577687 [Viridothelium virens]|uniref:HIT-type domain-containing protein n=1 Tax=Viridothelium virens TaxID=1048519 RepID=A0A6A6H566_VIRVR|nr:hypothetical protein EV356DRAFT_577687 [Viridothelium virens]
MTSHCKVCDEQPSKYKCPQCRIPYCSIGCFKTHKQQCRDQAKPEDSKQDDANMSTAEPRAFQASEEHVAQYQQPEVPNFASLEKSPDFLRLLAKYPNLKSQLKSIWKASLEPTEDRPQRSYRARGGRGSFRDRARQRRRGPWTPEQGHGDALDHLRGTHESDEGMREFVDLITLKYGTRSRIESRSVSE